MLRSQNNVSYGQNSSQVINFLNSKRDYKLMNGELACHNRHRPVY